MQALSHLLHTRTHSLTHTHTLARTHPCANTHPRANTHTIAEQAPIGADGGGVDGTEEAALGLMVGLLLVEALVQVHVSKESECVFIFMRQRIV